MANKTLTVPNISCAHCVRRINQALGAVPGVKAVHADAATKQVVLEYEGEDALERARAILNEIGYPPAE